MVRCPHGNVISSRAKTRCVEIGRRLAPAALGEEGEDDLEKVSGREQTSQGSTRKKESKNLADHSRSWQTETRILKTLE